MKPNKRTGRQDEGFGLHFSKFWTTTGPCNEFGPLFDEYLRREAELAAA